MLLTWLGLVPDLDQLLLPPAADLGDVQHALHHPRHQRALQLAPVHVCTCAGCARAQCSPGGVVRVRAGQRDARHVGARDGHVGHVRRVRGVHSLQQVLHSLQQSQLKQGRSWLIP